MEVARPILAITYAEEKLLEIFLSELPVLHASESFYFEGLQKYYGQEMGYPLYKKILSLRGFMRKEDLPEFKLWSARKEKQYASKGKRRLNIDPGYLDESHLVLASSKKRGGRVYVGSGVYAEIEYLYVYGGFRPLYWTYADYRDKRVRGFFESIRDDFLKELKLAWKTNELRLLDFSKDELYQVF